MNQQPEDRPGDEAFARQAGEMLRRSAEDIDAATASRLNRARQAALAGQPRAGRRPAWPVPAWSAAAAGALALAVWLAWPGDPALAPPAGPAVASAADMDLLLTDDNLEMFEDLEFYAWLDPELSDAQLGAELEAAG